MKPIRDVNMLGRKGGAISFREETRANNVRAFPFLVSFIRYPYQYGAIGEDGFYGNDAASAEGPDGILIPPLSTVQIPLHIDRDANFHMLWMRYVVYNPDSEPDEVPLITYGSRTLMGQPSTTLQGGQTPYQASWNQQIPYNSFVDVSVYIRSIGNRDLYGGMALTAQTNTYAEIPVPIGAIQTSEDGISQVRLPYLIPKDGLIMLKATNNFLNLAGASRPLHIHGHIFGYKVPL